MNMLLFITLFVPLASALALLLFRGVIELPVARKLALFASIMTLVASILLVYQFLQLPVTESRSRALRRSRLATYSEKQTARATTGFRSPVPR
jgi:hypothetical protein